MELSAQEAVGVATKQVKKRIPRAKMLRVRLSVEEALLVNDVIQKGNFADVATAIRYLLNHYDDIRKADECRKDFKQWRAMERKLAAGLED